MKRIDPSLSPAGSFRHRNDKAVGKVVPMHGHARRSGTDRYQQPADDPNDGFVVAVKTNACQQGEAEAVGVKRHDKIYQFIIS